jgi:hypothetical protein
MEKRHLLKLTMAVAVGAFALAASAQAAPLAPQPVAEQTRLLTTDEDVLPAVTSTDEVARLKPEEVRWGHHHWHHHWHHRWHHWHHWHRHW